MSQENVLRFIELLDQNQEFKSKCVDVMKKYLGQTLSQAELDRVYQEEILPITREAGFEITPDEFKELQNSPQSGQLSDEELGNVLGGSEWTFFGRTVYLRCYKDGEVKETLENKNYKCPKYERNPNVGIPGSACGTCKYFGFLGMSQ